MNRDPELVSRSPDIYMFTAPNPGPKTLSGTNTYVVLSENAYVIDPGPDDQAYQNRLAAWLRNTGVDVRAILLTHTHPDHAAGASTLKSLLEAPVLAGYQCTNHTGEPFHPDRAFKPDEKLPLGHGHMHLRACATPGHTGDHVAFHHPDAGILFSGDLILGQGSTLIARPEGDMRLYMESLERVAALKLSAIAPGHGPIVRQPVAKIREYIDHRVERERQILWALVHEPGTVEDIVDRVYVDIDPAIRDLAAESVRAQLDKLEYENRVSQRGTVYSTLEV